MLFKDVITGLFRGVFERIKGRIFDDRKGGGFGLNGLGFGAGNLIGKDALDIFAFLRKFCRARETATCSCSPFFAFFDDELSDCCATGHRKKHVIYI